MLKGHQSGVAMIENDVGYAIHALVTGDRNGGQRWVVRDGCVNGDDSLNAARDQELGIGLQQSRIVTVNYGEEKIIALAQILFYSADDHRPVHVADFLCNDANGIGSPYTQGSC